MKGNLILIHGGGPTAVINASLAGAIRQAQKEPNVDRILAAIGGTGGLMQGHVRDLTDISEAELAMLERTPGSAIGTSRDALEEEDYRLLAQKCVEYGAKVVLMNGGNGTMDACGKLCRALAGTDIRVMGIPKTMDNDIAVTDHAPGFGSAARVHCAECRGGDGGRPRSTDSRRRHRGERAQRGLDYGGECAGASGWRRRTGLIYLPERPFDEAQYLADVKALIEKKRGVVVVASEGLKDKDGKQIVEPIFKVGRATYFGDVSAHLANLVIKHLGYKARSEKPGLLGRASIPAVLQGGAEKEAILAGTEAVRAACAGESGKMVGFIRESTSPYRVRTTLIDVDDVMLVEKKMPDEYINAAGNGVTQAFIDWCGTADRRAAGKADFIKG